MEVPNMGRRKKKTAKIEQYLKNNAQEEKVVIEDPAENVRDEVPAIEMTDDEAATADVEDVIAEVEEKVEAEAKPTKRKRKKSKSED